MAQRTLKVAVMGLPNADESLIRGYFRMYASQRDLDVEWVAAGQQQEDLLLVNRLFMGSTQIQRMLDGQHLRVLWLQRHDTEGFHPVGERQHLLSLPVQSTSELYAQLDLACGFSSRQSGTVPDALATPQADADGVQVRAAQTADHQPLPSQTVGSQPAARQSEQAQVEQGQSDAVLAKLLTASQSGQLQHQGHKLGWLDSASGVVWTDALPDSTTSRQVSLVPMALPDNLAGLTAMPLTQWVFRLAWHEAGQQAQPVAAHARWQLHRWPQPDAGENQGHIFQVCGQLQVAPSTSGQLSQKTGLAPQTVNRILLALQLTGFGSAPDLVTDVSNGPTIAQALSAGTDQLARPAVSPSEGAGGLKGMLGRLRQKLGL